MLISVLGALFGVQSSKVQERDFVNGHAWWVYVLAALLLVLLFVLLLVGAAKLLIAT